MSTYIFKRVPLSMEDTDKLINAARDRQEKVVIYGLLETGMRISELKSLTKQSFMWQEGRVMVDGKGGPFGKKSKKRVIPLSNRARAIFESHFALEENIPWSIRTMQRVVKEVANRAGIMTKISPHVLRHTFASNCLRKGMDIKVVKELMGHSSILTTEIYLNISPEDVCRIFKERW